ncbi:UNVERIFIED_CONTAM: hypothetical protein FKN15_053447 [Acipenser sinensis]
MPCTQPMKEADEENELATDSLTWIWVGFHSNNSIFLGASPSVWYSLNNGLQTSFSHRAALDLNELYSLK